MYAFLTPYIHGSASLCTLPITDITQLSCVLSCHVVQFRHSWTAVLRNFRSCSHEEAGTRLTEKLTRQDATDPKQKAVTDYKEQVDRHPPPTQCTGKLKSRRTHTTTTDITTRSPISEQRPQEIAHVTYLTLI